MAGTKTSKAFASVYLAFLIFTKAFGVVCQVMFCMAVPLVWAVVCVWVRAGAEITAILRY